MKFILLIIFLLTPQSEALPPRATAETVEIYQKMSLGQFIDEIKSPKYSENHADIVRGAIDAKRYDLIGVCYENQETMSHARTALEELPPSEFKDESVIAILRSKSPYLPRILGQFDIRTGGIGTWPIEPFRSVIKKWLPNEPLEPAVMNTPEARAVLADKLEAAIAGIPAPESHALKTTKQGQSHSQTSPGSYGVSGATVAVAPPAVSPQPPSGYRWWWILGLFGLGVSLLLRRRARKV